MPSYVPWNYHKPVQRVCDFSGTRDLESFLDIANQTGLLVILRPGLSGNEPATTESTTTEPATIQITLKPTTGITSTPEQSTGNPDTLEKKRHIVRISIRAAGSVDVNDPCVYKAILDKVQELLSKQIPMSGSTLHWLEKDGVIFHPQQEEQNTGNTCE
ncbi:UNVERIFIED_CONTAM: hypothetical protein FKN15_069272 [Acipenser sinensis]